MQGYPEENELLSLFECEPTFLENPSDSVDFFYSEATYKFSNKDEDFVVRIAPSYGVVKIQVINRYSKNIIAYLDLKRVYQFEITADKKDSSSILMIIDVGSNTQTIEIDFKPNFKLIFKEHF